MRAVRSTEGGVAVVDLEKPPGTGELLAMKAASVCASDFSDIRFGSRFIRRAGDHARDHHAPLPVPDRGCCRGLRVAADRASGAIRVVIEPS